MIGRSTPARHPMSFDIVVRREVTVRTPSGGRYFRFRAVPARPQVGNGRQNDTTGAPCAGALSAVDSSCSDFDSEATTVRMVR